MYFDLVRSILGAGNQLEEPALRRVGFGNCGVPPPAQNFPFDDRVARRGYVISQRGEDPGCKEQAGSGNQE